MKTIWDKFLAITITTVMVIGAISVFIINVASWLDEHDSLTAFLALASLWFLRWLWRGKIRSEPNLEWAMWTLFVFGLGTYACLSHLDGTGHKEAVALGATVTIPVFVMSCFECKKLEAKEKERKKWDDPSEIEREREMKNSEREARKKEFVQFARELDLPVPGAS